MFEVTVTAATAGELRHKLISLVSAMLGEAPATASPASRAFEAEPEPATAAEAFPEPAIAEPEPVEEPIPDAPKIDAVAAEKLKADVIRNLQDLFKAGKVKTIRHVLTTYGDGAKSFPEIDAARFPAIREALARNEGA